MNQQSELRVCVNIIRFYADGLKRMVYFFHALWQLTDVIVHQRGKLFPQPIR